MRLVFGWNHFKIKSFDPFELGLTQKRVNDFTIEVRQSYFHFFWIPFFGLGKKWSIRKNDQLYELPAAYKDTIRQRDDFHLPTPWYTYAGPMLIALVGLCYVINSKYSYWERHRDFRNEYIMIAADNSRKFRKPTPDDYYVLTAADGSEKYAHITGLDKQHIQLSYINDPSIRADRPGQMADLFVEYADRLNTITINRADSAQLICREYEKRHLFAGISLNNDDGKTWRIENIIRMDGPIFKDDGFASHYADGGYSFCMNIENEGLPATITSIESVEGDIVWADNVLPLQAQPDRRIALPGKGNYNKSYKAKITCTDGQGRQLQYIMEGRRLHNTFRKIEL